METFDLAASDAEREALGTILSHAFGFPLAEVPIWFERAGAENIYAWRSDDAVAGGLITIPMGQFFGGRSVPTTGIAGVGSRATLAPCASCIRAYGSSSRPSRRTCVIDPKWPFVSCP